MTLIQTDLEDIKKFIWYVHLDVKVYKSEMNKMHYLVAKATE